MKFIQLFFFLLLSFFIQGCDKKFEADPVRDFVHYSGSTEAHPLIKGDVSCSPNSADCNVCANDVQKQFHRAASNELTWVRYPWKLNWSKAYAPNNIVPSESFLNNYLVKHVQGFSRTNSKRYPYAGTHSDDKKGGVFVIEKTDDGLQLVTLHNTGSAHPSGTHVIGDYFVYGDSAGLIFKSISSPNQQKNISIKNTKAFGGGLGLAKISNDKYVVITTGPGGDKTKVRTNHFYQLDFSNGEPSNDLEYISSSIVEVPDSWGHKEYKLSENLSVITECGTGDIYTIHATGGIDELTKAPFGKSSYWRLSKLESKNDALTLTAINYMKAPQNTKSCNPRASGTVSVSKDHGLEFYCHQHSKSNPKGSYSFKKGILK